MVSYNKGHLQVRAAMRKSVDIAHAKSRARGKNLGQLPRTPKAERTKAAEEIADYLTRNPRLFYDGY